MKINTSYIPQLKKLSKRSIGIMLLILGIICSNLSAQTSSNDLLSDTVYVNNTKSDSLAIYTIWASYNNKPLEVLYQLVSEKESSIDHLFANNQAVCFSISDKKWEGKSFFFYNPITGKSYLSMARFEGFTPLESEIDFEKKQIKLTNTDYPNEARTHLILGKKVLQVSSSSRVKTITAQLMPYDYQKDYKKTRE